MRDIFVARQPIFDAHEKIVAYELLYRSSASTGAAGVHDPSAISSSVIVDGVVGMGLSSLTEGQKAFINFDADMLLDGAAELLPPASIVIEVLENVTPTDAILAKLHQLSEQGYALALDDFVYDDLYRPMLELANIVKVDLLASSDGLDETLTRLSPFDVTLLAEKVEDREIHDRCVAQGFGLFQGFHYRRPETLTKRDLSAQSVHVIRLMNLIQDPRATDGTIEDAFRADPSLTYKLLRIVNAAVLGGRGVQSIAHAIRLVGREPLYRWLCLLLLTTGGDDGDMRLERVKDTLMRARMCEGLGEQIRSTRGNGVPSGGSLFLIGLFSQVDQLLGVPVDAILDEVSVAPEVRDALIGHEGPGGVILRAVESYAGAEWDSASEEITGVGGTVGALADTYLEAVAWAGTRLALHSEAA